MFEENIHASGVRSKFDICSEDIYVTKNKNKSEALNDYFVNIRPTLAEKYEEESCNIAQTTNDNFNSFLCA